MAKIQFLPYPQNQTVLFPQRIDEDIVEDSPVRIIISVVDSLNLGQILSLYSDTGCYGYHPRMMLKVILYAYMNNIYSCRKIESLLLRDLHFIWLAGYQKPDFITINRFRNRVKDEMNGIFTQIVLVLASKGLVSLDAEYIDGTKIESKANKYTFVWRKSVEKNRVKLLEKIRILLEQIDDGVAQENSKENKKVEYTPELLTEIVDELRDSLSQETEDKDKAKAKKKAARELEKKAEKLQEYDNHQETLGKRNSYSKTDPSATFMRMKEDAMMNGQTKPGYNLLIATENQFIVDFGLFHNPTDTLTLIPFFKSFSDRYGKLPTKAVADSGYGSEENYRFMDENGMDAYVKYNFFHKEHRPKYVPNPFKSENFFYNEKYDFCVCPMGQHMRRTGTKKGKTESGYTTECATYQAVNCQGCPLRGMCFKSDGNRTVEINHRLKAYRKKASDLLTSEEGIKERGRRCIEPEAVFGQIKNNMGYRRFRHFGSDKVYMDFAFFAIAFNLKKMCKKTA